MADAIILFLVASYCIFLIASQVRRRFKGGGGCTGCCQGCSGCSNAALDKLIREAEKRKEGLS